LLALFRALGGIYFRDLEVIGVPPEGTRGCLFAANHVNALIDPILVLTSVPFPIAPVAKAPLFHVPAIRSLLRVAEAVPVVRKQDAPGAEGGSNEAVFDKIADHFARGGNLLIFPEGISHDEPRLAPIKTGPARMLARAHARGARGLTFQAVGLEFDARDTFRSRALVLFGPVREVDALAEGDLVARITDALRDDLRALVIEGNTWPERRLVARVAELLAHEEGDRTLGAWNEIGRKVAAARRVLGEPHDEPYRDVEGAVSRYYALLAETGAREDRVVADLPPRPGRLLRAAGLIAILPLALVGFVLHALPYQVPRLSTRLSGREQDLVSTYKLGLGLAAYATWLVGLSGAAFATLGLTRGAAAAAVVVSSALAALVWLDRGELLSARGSARWNRGRLRAARAEALAAIARARAEVEARAEPSP
jgi:glycerol-3-phosphate O-acyltransferase/dihydroxyacetone phosphate acyltransferase